MATLAYVKDVFKIGIGPSSSHTVGPMRAAKQFLDDNSQLLHHADRVQADLFGSLALTGKGHATDIAIMLGFSGALPATVEVAKIDSMLAHIHSNQRINLNQTQIIHFNTDTDLLFHANKVLPEHANGMVFSLYNAGKQLACETYFSVGGGLIRTRADLNDNSNANANANANEDILHSFHTGAQMLALCQRFDCSIADLMLRNAEYAGLEETLTYVDTIWSTMQTCVQSGLTAPRQILPGGLNVKRRAPEMYAMLSAPANDSRIQTSVVFDWISLYALAVNEENAAGKRVVTAPTNGSAGVIPAVMHYAKQYYPNTFTNEKAQRFLLTSSAIGVLYQKGASISAAEMGCQGEIGVSCSMAAASLCEFLGGTVQQIANAAEIGMEHHLGTTCDPVHGLVQIPCIERNTMGALKAVNAARLAILRNEQCVTLDQVIRTMFETGKDMSHKYKETAQGGLATNVAKTAYHITLNQVAC